MTLEWLNENALRAYPFILNCPKTANTSYVLDNGLILDLLIVNNSAYSGSYKLLSIDNSVSGTIIFNFTNSVSFTFSTSLTGIQYIKGANHSALAVNTDLISAIPAAINTFANLIVEPSLVFEFYNDWIGVNELAITPSYESGGLYSYSALLPLVSQSTINLTGAITFFEGYNFDISFDTINNLINFQAGDSFGIPLTCEDNFINPALCDCPDIISFINGVPPDSNGNFNIAPGLNINLIFGTAISNVTTGLPENFYDGINGTEPANTHSLFIGLTLQSSDLCHTLQLAPN
jgi:hypothetical protein